MNKTQIEWVKNPDGTLGYTWNPITGCLNHVNGMCKGGGFPCYAYRLANGRLRERYLANKNRATLTLLKDVGAHNDDPFYSRFWPERMDDFNNLFAINEPNFSRRLPKKPRGIFVCDMSDLFGMGIPEKWTRDVLDVIEEANYHRFYLLTKQPQNLIKFSPFPDNCWVGVTATKIDAFYHAIQVMPDIQCKRAFISFEPLLGRIEAPSHLYKTLDWVIIGAQTKPTVYPKIEWVKEIVEAADKAGIPVFLKDNLAPLIKSIKGENFYLRQEMPKNEAALGSMTL